MSGGNNDTLLAETIKSLVLKILEDYLCFEPVPAKVLKYDFKKRTADIKPLVGIIDKVGDVLENQELPDIPVIFPACEKSAFSMPIENCEGLLIFTKLGIENWQFSGGEQSEAITTRYSRRNAFFIPGLINNKTENKYIDNGDDYIRHFFEKSEFRVTKDEKLNFVINEVNLTEQHINDTINTTNLSDKIKSALQQVSTALNALATATYGGVPGPASCAADLTAAKSQIDSIVSEIDQIKSKSDEVKQAFEKVKK